MHLLLTFVLLAPADADSDARAALALSGAKAPVPSPCNCTSPKDCSCPGGPGGGLCKCAACKADAHAGDPLWADDPPPGAGWVRNGVRGAWEGPWHREPLRVLPAVSTPQTFMAAPVRWSAGPMLGGSCGPRG